MLGTFGGLWRPKERETLNLSGACRWAASIWVIILATTIPWSIWMGKWGSWYMFGHAKWLTFNVCWWHFLLQKFLQHIRRSKAIRFKVFWCFENNIQLCKKVWGRHDFRITNATIEDIRADLEPHNVLPRAIVTTSKWYIRVTKAILRCPTAFTFVQDGASDRSKVSLFDFKTIPTPNELNMFLLPRDDAYKPGKAEGRLLCTRILIDQCSEHWCALSALIRGKQYQPEFVWLVRDHWVSGLQNSAFQVFEFQDQDSGNVSDWVAALTVTLWLFHKELWPRKFHSVKEGMSGNFIIFVGSATNILFRAEGSTLDTSVSTCQEVCWDIFTSNAEFAFSGNFWLCPIFENSVYRSGAETWVRSFAAVKEAHEKGASQETFQCRSCRGKYASAAV